MTRTWFLTGIGSGFGRELTTQLLARGDRVAGTVRRPEAVADLTSAYPDSLHVSVLDLTDTDRIRPVVDDAHERFDRLDVVVSNAGYGLFGAAEELTDAQVRHQIDTNLLGSVQVVRAALPHLRTDGGGRILQLSSVAGQTGYAGASLYHATKWAVEGFAEALAGEVAAFGIGVTIVEPGSARTGFASTGRSWGPRLDAYDVTPVAAVRRMLEAGDHVAPGDPVRMASAMIDSVDVEPAPLRLVLGSDSWRGITAALEQRLAAVRAQEASAALTDG
ncbi:MAG TPA: SDR family oxidoreductase [Cellulomonas sp.]